MFSPSSSRSPTSSPTAPGLPPAIEIEVEVSDTQAHLPVEPGRVEDLVRRALVAAGITSANISVALVDDATIHAINGKHLGHDWPTDVITFPLSEPGDPELAGELVVSAEMAMATAAEASVPPWSELALYIVHGLLHLCGYDDLDDASVPEMRRKEDEVLAALGLTNTFAKVGQEPSAPGQDFRLEPGSERSTWPA